MQDRQGGPAWVEAARTTILLLLGCALAPAALALAPGSLIPAAAAGAGAALPEAGAALSDLKITNVRDGSFAVSWLSAGAASGSVNYGSSAALGSSASDDRGAAYTGRTHYVTLAGLTPETTYYFDVVDGGAVDNNGGAHYQVTTGPVLSPPTPDTAYGQVFLSDGATAADGAIVTIFLEDQDGSGSAGSSAEMSALVTSGFWSIGLGSARLSNLSGPFNYSASGDQLLLHAQGGAEGEAWATVNTSNDSPAAAMTLSGGGAPPASPLLASVANSDGDGTYTVNWSAVIGASGYELQEQLDSAAWHSIYTGTQNSFQASGRANGNWCYQVRATSASGPSEWSDSQCALVAAGVPLAPQLAAIDNADQDRTYAVTWSPVTGATGYQLQERFAGGAWDSIYSGPDAAYTALNRSGGEWCYRAAATNGSGPSDWSNTRCITILPEIPLLAGISNPGNDAAFAVSWLPVAGATGYELQEQRDGASWLTIYDGPLSSRDLTFRTPGDYCYQVRASNGAGNGAWSNSQCTTVLPPTVQFDSASYSRHENDGSANLTVRLSYAAAETITVDFASANGTASAGSDYITATGTLTWTVGQTTKNLAVAILDDAEDEANETLTVALAAPAQAVLGSPATTTVTIIDDEGPPTVQFSPTSYTAGEADGLLSIVVTLSRLAAAGVSVNYATSAGTAAAGADFTAISGTLTLPAGQLQASLDLPILADAQAEGDETLQLILSEPVGAELGVPGDIADVTIVDDDLPAVRFGRSDYSVVEGEAPVVIAVNLDGASTEVVTVQYASGGGTALAGDDYTPVNGTLTFAPGKLALSFSLAALADGHEEGVETVNLVLANPQQALLGEPAVATVHIHDAPVGPTPRLYLPIILR